MSSKILLVEDDEMNVKLFRLILTRKGGFEVESSEDVEEILSLASRGAVDLIIMDISLDNSTYRGENIDGIGITKLLKADASTKKIPVLLATAHAMKGNREKFLRESGADGYITKPIVDFQFFLNTVNGLLNRKVRSG